MITFTDSMIEALSADERQLLNDLATRHGEQTTDEEKVKQQIKQYIDSYFDEREKGKESYAQSLEFAGNPQQHPTRYF